MGSDCIGENARLSVKPGDSCQQRVPASPPNRAGGSVADGQQRVEEDFQRCCHCGGALVRKAFRQVVDPVDQWEERQKAGKKLPPLP